MSQSAQTNPLDKSASTTTQQYRSRRNHRWSLPRHLVLPIILTILNFISGTTGYYLLWRNQGGTFLDALYMTTITIVTIGYGEVYPLDSTGRVFTMILAVVGTGTLFYLAGAVIEHLVAIQFDATRIQRKVMDRIESLRGHYVVVGYGRVGRRAVHELLNAGKKVVVIDDSEGFPLNLESFQVLHVKGDATDDLTLHQAGIDRCDAVIVATGSDATNVFVVLSARSLRPDVTIIARAEDESTGPKLMRAGASKVVVPHSVSGFQMAGLVLRPNTIQSLQTMIDGVEITIQSLIVGRDSPIAGTTLSSVRSSAPELTFLAINRDGTILGQFGTERIEPGDHLIVLGTAQEIANFDLIVQPQNPAKI